MGIPSSFRRVFEVRTIERDCERLIFDLVILARRRNDENACLSTYCRSATITRVVIASHLSTLREPHPGWNVKPDAGITEIPACETPLTKERKSTCVANASCLKWPVSRQKSAWQEGDRFVEKKKENEIRVVQDPNKVPISLRSPPREYSGRWVGVRVVLRGTWKSKIAA